MKSQNNMVFSVIFLNIVESRFIFFIIIGSFEVSNLFDHLIFIIQQSDILKPQ